MLLRGCELADATSCLTLASHHSEGKGGVPKDAVKAREIYEKACNLGKREGCEKATKK